ncbi:MAG: L-2-amino-thiazoline-4-carboxylic acid hydrolase [Gammaproteobacteria bacterium]|nr:L-2-amino-thiazoline-4-carboxylic acid hydrolase [Gammaproteobacteria bacterium]
MTREENEQFVRDVFDEFRVRIIPQLVGRLVDDDDARTVVEEAAEIFDRMIPDMAYVDNPKHSMAFPLFICNVNLAVFLALKKRGVDAHAFGNAMLTGLAAAPLNVPDEPLGEGFLEEGFAEFVAVGEASQKDPVPGEFVLEVLAGDQNEFEFGYNIKSCAICHSFSKYDAMDLVPYMCATDDVMSDKGNQGLQRTGSIAVGAHHCDFRYKRGGEPRRLVTQYPDRIRTVEG